jgi:HAD superfamily hydrolase (TIGR01509 family)
VVSYDRCVTGQPAPTLALQAVLFDMDGTLVDTEPYWIAAEYALVAAFGGSWSDEHAHAIVGKALLDSAAYLRDNGGVELDPHEIVTRLEEQVVAAAVESPAWRPGARELLGQLRARGVPCALVTMSYERLATTIVRQLPEGTFDVVVTGDQVDDGKPHPEAYLTAMARLGVPAAYSVAIEDSPTGVTSAEAAGCLVLAVPHHVPIGAEPGRVLVDSLQDVTVDMLAELVARR